MNFYYSMNKLLLIVKSLAAFLPDKQRENALCLLQQLIDEINSSRRPT